MTIFKSGFRVHLLIFFFHFLSFVGLPCNVDKINFVSQARELSSRLFIQLKIVTVQVKRFFLQFM